MYKSKLQELCHKQKWGLPKYTCMKDGPEHCPEFKVSVVVAGINFNTPTICKSSKEAYNEVAKLAFLHFTSEAESSYQTKEQKELITEKEIRSPKVHLEPAANQQHGETPDFSGRYRKKLQILAERNDLGKPMYHVGRDGPCGSNVKATVYVGEDCFISQGLYKTSEEAKDAAAQVALLSLSTEVFQEEEGFYLPMYTTIMSGKPQNQTYLSSVEVEGEIFHGTEAKTKKLAELNAAKAAYTVFLERKLFRPGYSSRTSADDTLNLASRVGSVTISHQQGNDKPGFPANPSTAIEYELQRGENKDEKKTTEYLSNCVSNNHNISTHQESIALPTLPVTESRTADSDMNTDAEKRCYLLRNRVKVYTYIPEIALPVGTVVLPIARDKWATVSLEFPNENGM